MGVLDLMSWMNSREAAISSKAASKKAGNIQKRVNILEESQKAEMKLLFAICKKLNLDAAEIIKRQSVLLRGNE